MKGKEVSYNERMSYSWKDFFEDVNSICLQLGKEKVDVVVAVAQGGISLGVVLANKLDVPLFSVRVKSYIGKGKKGNLFIGEIPSELKGKKVIVVDDIIDTKETIVGVCERLKDYNVNVLSRVVLCRREGVEVDCIFAREVKKWVWIDFPWEV